MSPQRAKLEHTSMEFLCWCVRREQRMNEHTVEHYYLAAIATIIEMANSKNPDKVKLDNHLLRFIPPKPEEEKTEEELIARVEKSKNAWGAFTGAKNDNSRNAGSQTDDRPERVGPRNGAG